MFLFTRVKGYRIKKRQQVRKCGQSVRIMARLLLNSSSTTTFEDYVLLHSSLTLQLPYEEKSGLLWSTFFHFWYKEINCGNDNYLRHVCLSVHLSAWNNSTPPEQIFMKFAIWIFFESISRKLKFHWNRTRIAVLYVRPIYEGWNFNSGNYLFTTDTK